VWSCPPLIPALGWLRQEYHEFETSLGYEGDPASKQKKKEEEEEEERKKRKSNISCFHARLLNCQ
jgi:hypothetical protein